MKIKITLILILFFTTLSAQVKRAELFIDYSMVPTGGLIGINEAAGFGGGAKAAIGIIENFTINLRTGYNLFSISDPTALNSWGWEFWTDRYYPKIVSDLRADPNLSVRIEPVQKMDVIPLEVTLGYLIRATDKLSFTAEAGGGFYFYNRRLFALEDWTKRFPSAEYEFNYTYRNFAPAKKGNPLFVSGGAAVRYEIITDFALSAGFGYSSVIATEGSMGYDDFPIKNLMSLKFGIQFIY
jgi:hypothetical protein